MVCLMYKTHQFEFSVWWAQKALLIAHKRSKSILLQALARGVLYNALVCL